MSGGAAVVGLIISAIATAVAGTAQAAATSEAGEKAEGMANRAASEQKAIDRINKKRSDRQMAANRMMRDREIGYTKFLTERERNDYKEKQTYDRYRNHINTLEGMINSDALLKQSMMNRIAMKRGR